MTFGSASHLASKQIPTAFGQMHVRLTDPGRSSEVVIFLHGFGSNGEVWAPVVDASTSAGLLAGRDIMVVDLPGFGHSENRLRHLDMATVGGELLRIAAEHGYTTIRVAGHSMGGFLTLDMAARFPHAISSIHIVSGSYFTLTAMVNRPLATALRAPLIACFYWLQVYIASHDGLARRLNGWLAGRPSAKPHYSLGGPEFRYGARNGKNYDADRIWARISMPVYGAFGSQDRLVPPSDMYHLQSLIPAAHLYLVPGTGHSSLVEQPERVASILFGGLPVL
jgi:pimeloyl-ACP methyl ester carboxylesterase